MGRPRKSRGKTREIISISLDKDVIQAFDETLGDMTRSRRIEALIKAYLGKSKTDLKSFGRHLYECDDCHRQFHINRYMDPDIMVCRGDTGCYGIKIHYLGNLEEYQEKQGVEEE